MVSTVHIETLSKCSVDVADLLYAKIGRLYVKDFSHVEPKPTKIKGYETYLYFYNCICECGKELLVERSPLKRHGTLSCGCLVQEVGQIIKPGTPRPVIRLNDGKWYASMKEAALDIGLNLKSTAIIRRSCIYGQRIKTDKGTFRFFYDDPINDVEEPAWPSKTDKE